MEKNRRARAEATRQQLLAAARVVFAERGYSGATVAAITDRAETAHGTFYLYFKNKEAIFVDLVSDVLEELYQHSFTPIEELPGHYDVARSRKRIAGFLTAFARNGALWRAVLEGALASPVVEAHWMDARRRFVASVDERWQVFQGSGTLPAFDTSVAATAMCSMLEWVAFTSMAFAQPVGAAVEGPGGADQLLQPEVIDALTQVWTRAIGQAG